MEQKTKLLLAEDDENLGLLLKEYLVAKGYEANLYPDGEAAYKGFMKEHYDICILDIMMPKKDGFTLAKDIRIVNPDIPDYFSDCQKSKGRCYWKDLKLGADDYITKPFSMEELILRIEAILRRTSQECQARMHNRFLPWENITFDTRKQILSDGEETVKLTTKESDLLKLLCQNANKVLERNYALKSIWIDDNYFNARSMDVYITKLRKHLKDEPSVEIINVHGKGYKLIV